MKFANATKPRQEIQGMGHPEVGGTSCRMPFHPPAGRHKPSPHYFSAVANELPRPQLDSSLPN
jgi:hypothetical protein